MHIQIQSFLLRAILIAILTFTGGWQTTIASSLSGSNDSVHNNIPFSSDPKYSNAPDLSIISEPRIVAHGNHCTIIIGGVVIVYHC